MDPNELDVKPAHKITYTVGSTKYTYWYAKRDPTCRDFDKMKNWDLVKQMYDDGAKMTIGGKKSITTPDGGQYSIKRTTADEFVVEALN